MKLEALVRSRILSCLIQPPLLGIMVPYTYVNDIVVKSDKKEMHIEDLQETFANLRKSGLKLNPDKCIFSIYKGKLLGCLVFARRN